MDNASTIALSRVVVQQRALDVAAGNLANTSTPGYKAERVVFSDWLSRQSGTDIPAGDRNLAYVQDRATYRDQANGPLEQTGNPLDLALSGNGYFTVSTPRGPRLTRAGRFSLQSDGTIADTDGNTLLDSTGQKLTVSPTDTRLTVAADGTLSSENGQIGKIGVVVPSDPYQMQAEGGRLYAANTPTASVTAPQVVQGAVEGSNVQAAGELTNLLAIQREFQFATQFVEAEGQREQSAIDKIVSHGS